MTSLRGCISICVALAGAALAQAQAIAPPRAVEDALDAPLSGKQASLALESARERTAKSLARIRVYHRIENLFADGRVAASTEADLPTIPGIVVDALPIVAVSAAHIQDYAGAQRVGNPNSGKLLPRVSSPYVRMVGPLYQALLDDGRRIELVERERSRPLNLLFLEVAPNVDPPPELRCALAMVEPPRRFGANERIGAIAYKNLSQSSITVAVPTSVQAGAEQFLRPAVSEIGGSNAGAPVVNTSGEWLAIVNMQPPELGIPHAHVAKPKAEDISIDRDPREWMSGYLSPVLMSITELAPEIARVREALTQPRELPEFGITIADRNGRVILVAVDGNRLKCDPPAAAGDVLVRLGDRTVASTRTFDRVLEAALAGTEGELIGDLERNGERIPFRIALP